MREVCLLAPQDLSQYWNRVTNAWNEFPALGEYFELGHIPELIFKHNYHLWFAINENEVDGVMVTNLLIYPKKRVLHVALVTGRDLSKYLDLGIHRIECFALWQEASTVVFDGQRPGLERIMRKLGYKRVLRMEKNVARSRGN